MKNKTALLTFFLLATSATCFGQSSFQQLTPGVSTRSNVSTALGQPVREVSKTLMEYAPPAGIANLYVQYGDETSVIDRIEVLLLKPVLRSAILSRFNLPDQPAAQEIRKDGKRVEYFDGSALIVLTYASTEASSGVSRVGYYNRELFDTAVANVARSPQPQDRSNTADSSSPERPRTPESTPRTSGSPASSTGTSSSSEAERTTATVTRSSPSADRHSTPTLTRIPDELRDGPGAVAVTEMRESNNGVSISQSRLDSLVGRYEFDAAYVPSLAEVIVDKVDGKLRWKDRSTTDTLIASAVGQQTDTDGRVTEEMVQFKLAGKPGAMVQFILSKGRVDRVTYLEDKTGTGKMIFAIGTPKD